MMLSLVAILHPHLQMLIGPVINTQMQQNLLPLALEKWMHPTRPDHLFVQLEIQSIDISESGELTIARMKGKASPAGSAYQSCKGDVLTSTFVIQSKAQQRLETAGDLVIKWKRQG